MFSDGRNMESQFIFELLCFIRPELVNKQHGIDE